MDPILKYPGAKWRLAKWILSNMPPHESYLEPFFGSGAVFFNKTPSRIETVNDLDGEIIRFFKTCRDHPDDLARAISLTPWSRTEFQHATIGDPCMDDIERARCFAVRCWMSFGGRLYKSNTWRHSTGAKQNGGPDNPKLWGRLPRVVLEVAKRLKEAQIEQRPAIELIKKFNGPKVLIYADPPYLRSTRTLHGDQYLFEMTEEDHRQLLAALLEHEGPVLLSGYDSALYSEAPHNWRRMEIRTTAERGIKRTECLWVNQVAEKGTPCQT